MRRHINAGVALAVLASLVTLLSPALRQAPSAVAAPGDGPVTWTVDHNKKTIEVVAKLEIYSGCSGDPFGGASEQARACDLPRSMIGGPTQLLADKIKRSIEAIWNKPYKYRCYELKFKVDVKLGSDASQVDSDRIGIRIDPSPAGIRSYVHTEGIDRSRWQSDDPADRLNPENGGEHVTTWAENSNAREFAHEFGHILGLHDAYSDVIDEFVIGEVVSEPLPGAPIDLMSTATRSSIAQETIDRVVHRNIPQMRDTEGKPVTDEDLNCDYQGEFSGKYLAGTLRWCGLTEHPYWGLDIVRSDGLRAFISFLIPPGSDETVAAELTTPFREPKWDAYISGNGAFIPGDPPHFLLDIGDGTYIIELEKGNFCRPNPEP